MILLNKSQINNILQFITTQKVLVIGDCMLDHYIWGDVHRISPEAPVPVVQIDRDTYRLGGACNVALNLKQLGADVSLLGLVGEDTYGKLLTQLIRDFKIHFLDGNIHTDINSIVKTRVVVRDQQLCRLDREKTFPSEKVEAFLPILEKTISQFSVVIVSDYAKGTVTQMLLEKLVDLKKQHSFFLAVDPKPSHQLNYSGIDLLKPNRSEALQLSHRTLKNGEAFPLKEIAQAIFKEHASRFLAITLGEQGIAVLDQSLNGDVSPIIPQEVFDVSGAGDTAVVALTMALCSGSSLIEAAHFANILSGIVVGKIGTASILPEEILAYVS